jgi:hypothetical protein
MLRERERDCLWLQSIKNILYVKSCMCDSLYVNANKKMSSVCANKISRKKIDFSVLGVVFLCIQKAATHDTTR